MAYQRKLGKVGIWRIRKNRVRVGIWRIRKSSKGGNMAYQRKSG